MLGDMQRDMQWMMQGMQQDMWQMQQQMQHQGQQMQRDMHSNMAQAQQQMHSDMAQMPQFSGMHQQMQSDAWQHRPTHHDAMRASREQRRESRLQHRDARDREREMRRSQRQAFGGGPVAGGLVMRGLDQQGVRTSVVNGDVYINDEFVTRLPPGGPVSMETSNGVVRINGNVVWPRAGEAWLPPEGTLEVQQPLGDTADLPFAGGGPFAPPSRRHRAHSNVEEATPVRAEEDPEEEATRVAYHSSCVGSCPRDHPEPCSVCLDDIKVGQQIRTLPCFHFLHRHCAEAHFARPSVLEPRLAGRSPTSARR